MARRSDPFNDAVGKVMSVMQLSESPKAITQLLAENCRYAKRVKELEGLLMGWGEGGLPCNGTNPKRTSCNDIKTEADRIRARKVARRQRGAK